MLSQPLLAQKEGAIWYFGQGAGLDFNQYFPKPLTEGKINTREGVASICDADGNLLFYTDGQTVYNKNHEIMTGGEGLYGNTSSTQSSIVVPLPGSSKTYYIFTVDLAESRLSAGYHGLCYSIVDMNDPLGRVRPKNTPLPNTTGILFTEKITVVKHSDKTSYWIIAHEFGTANFYEFRLTASGLVAPIVNPAGAIHAIDLSDEQNRGATGYLKSSPKGDFLATAIEGLKFFELFTFDNSSGKLALIAKLPTSTDPLHAYSESAYGVEFSPTSNFLYGSSRKNGYLYQWDISSGDRDKIISSMQIIRQKSGVMCGALQLGLNGKIYVSLSGQPYLGVINSPIQKNCNYVEQGASLLDNTQTPAAGGRAYFGLPTFLSDFFKAADFYYESTCQNDTTRFYLSANRVTIAGKPTWEIYDESGNRYIDTATVDPDTWEGTYVFKQAGNYLIKFEVPQYGSTIRQEQVVTIHPIPPIDLPDTTSMCQGSPAHLDAGEGAFYDWSDNPNLKVERYRDIYTAGKIIVKVTHYSGCYNIDSTLIVPKPLPVLVNEDISFATCGMSNGSITLTMATGDTYDYAWTKFPQINSNRLTDLPVGTYEVVITSQTTSCQIKKTFSVSAKGAPVVSITASTDQTICRGDTVTLTARGAVNYLWENPSGISSSVVKVSPSITTTYRVMGYSIDQATQDTCSSYKEVTIPVYPYNPPQLGADREACQGETITLDGGSAYQSWNWNSVDPPLNVNSRKIDITRSYDQLCLWVTDQNRCTFSDTIKVNIKSLPAIDLGGDSLIQCKGKPIVLYGGIGDSLLWSTKETTAQIEVNKTATYSLSIWKNGCVNTDSIAVKIKPLPIVDLNLPRDTTICLADSIKLSGGQGDHYLWSTHDTTSELYVKQSGSYWLSIDFDGCQNSDTVNLTINPLPEVDLGRDTVYCKSHPVVLQGDDGNSDSYLWSTNETTPTISINSTGTYKLTVGKKGCFQSDEVNIRVNDPALLAIDSVVTTPVTCPGKRDGSLRIYSHGSGKSWEYSIDGGLNYYPSALFQGLYGNNNFTISVREDKACESTYYKAIEFQEPDSIKIRYRLVSPSCETCPDGTINLSVSGGTPPYSYRWSTHDTGTYLSNMVLGKYLVWVTDAMNCTGNALIDLTLDYPPFQVPNAFTPNGDGSNEKWVIEALKDYPGCELKIYNRAGKLVWWSETGYPEPWDGKDKSGNVLPVGAYYYLIWLQSGSKPMKGSVSILR